MSKRGKRTKVDVRGPLQRLYDKSRVANDQSHLSVITEEQRSKGTYQGERIIVNNHDPVDRWKAAGKLTQSQQVAIELCQRLWRLAGLEQRVTATYGERTAASTGIEQRALTEIEAREDLHRIQDYFPGTLKAYYRVFENVCRHGMSAGIAGGDDRNAANTAYTTVCFVADYIATRERI